MKDLIKELEKSRIILLNSEINDEVATSIMFQMLNFEKDDPTRPIKLYINSPGGSIQAGMIIYDTMKLIKCDVETICYGMAASMAAFLLAAGKKGCRSALPHSTVMIHQPLRGFGNNYIQQTDIKILSDNITKTRLEMETLLAEFTNQKLDKIHIDCERDNYMSSAEALDYGLIDNIKVGK